MKIHAVLILVLSSTLILSATASADPRDSRRVYASYTAPAGTTDATRQQAGKREWGGIIASYTAPTGTTDSARQQAGRISYSGSGIASYDAPAGTTDAVRQLAGRKHSQ